MRGQNTTATKKPGAETSGKLLSALRAEKNTLVYRNSELAAKVDELEHKVMALSNELEFSRGLRSQIRNLFKRIDYVIEERIYPSRERERINIGGLSDKLPLSDKPLKQLALIAAYDQENLTRLKYDANHLRKYFLSVYRFFRDILVMLVRLGLKVLRRLIRLAR